MAQSKYQLKKEVGTLPIEFGSSEFINNENITDELAEKFLKKNPNRHIVFEKLPKNWKNLIKANSQKLTAKNKKLTIKN